MTTGTGTTEEEYGFTGVAAFLQAGILTRVPDSRIQFPYDAVKVEFYLSAA